MASIKLSKQQELGSHQLQSYGLKKPLKLIAGGLAGLSNLQPTKLIYSQQCLDKQVKLN